MFGVPSPDQLLDDAQDAADTVAPGIDTTDATQIATSFAAGGSLGGLASVAAEDLLGSSDDATSSSGSASGSSGDGDIYGWERQGGAPNHLPDATEDSTDDGYSADDTISEGAADYDRVLDAIQDGDSDAVYTGDMGDGSSSSSGSTGSTSGSSGSAGVDIPALGIAGASTSTMLVGAFAVVVVLAVAASALDDGHGAATGGSAS